MRYLSPDNCPGAVYVVPGFLDAALCRELRAHVAMGSHGPAYISGLNGAELLDEARRRTRRVLVPEAAQCAVQESLVRAIAEIQRYFTTAIARMQYPQFLRYRRGDFFRAHQDSSEHPEQTEEVRRRRVSAVLFLNRQTRFPEPDAYCGGELTLFRADDDPDPRLHVAGEDGLLVAFPSRLIHEVRPVTHGERYTVVTWYEADSE